MKKSQKGFTLVELIVVIAIIGVLAAILVPAMVGYIKDSKLSSANSSAKTVYTAVNNACQKALTKGDPIGDGEYKIFIDKVDDAGAAKDAPTGTGDVDVLAAAIFNTLNEDADNSVAKIQISKGFPTKVEWAKTKDDTYVGRYPTPADEEASTALNITSNSGPAAGTPSPAGTP